MTWITRQVLVISAAIFLSFFATPNSAAQQCSFSGNCPMPLMCQPGWFGGYCAIQACNADTDCRNQSVCDFGTCQIACSRSRDCPSGQVCVRGDSHPGVCAPRPVSSSGGSGSSSGGGTTRYYIEGGACGVIRQGQIIKHMGCAPGLRCSNPNGRGTCQKLPA